MIHSNHYRNALPLAHAPKIESECLQITESVFARVYSTSYTKHLATEMSVTVISSPGVIYGFPKNKGPLALCLLLRSSWAEGYSLCATWHWAIRAQGQAGRGGGGTVKYDHRLLELMLGSSRFSHSSQNEKVTQRELKWMLPRKRKKKRGREGGNTRARETDKDITPREI